MCNAIKLSQDNNKVIIDDSENLSGAEIKEAHQNVGCVQWYSCILDAPTLTAVSKAVVALADKIKKPS